MDDPPNVALYQRVMTFEQAVRLSLTCIEHEIQRLAVDANLHDTYNATYPAATNASNYRQHLLNAVSLLRESIGLPPRKESKNE